MRRVDIAVERFGALRRERDGWYHRCYLEAAPLEDAVSFLARYQPFWEHTLDELARYVDKPGAKHAPKKKAPRT